MHTFSDIVAAIYSNSSVKDTIWKYKSRELDIILEKQLANKSIAIDSRCKRLFCGFIIYYGNHKMKLLTTTIENDILVWAKLKSF